MTLSAMSPTSGQLPDISPADVVYNVYKLEKITRRLTKKKPYTSEAWRIAEVISEMIIWGAESCQS